MSCAPSPSASRNAPPAPIVSGRYFLPNAPLSWRKRMPAAFVTSVKVGSVAAVISAVPARAAAVRPAANDRFTGHRRSQPSGLCMRGFRLEPEGCRRRRFGSRPSPATVPMLVDRLPLVVVVGVQLAIRPGDRLRRLVCLEAPVERFLARRLLRTGRARDTRASGCSAPAGPPGRRRARACSASTAGRYCRCRNSTRPSWLSTTRSRGYFDDAVRRCAERLVVAARLLSAVPRKKCVLASAGSIASALPQHLLGAGHVAFLEARARDVDPAVGVAGLHLRHFEERGFRRLQIPLQQQPDAVVVPALAHRLVHERRRRRQRRRPSPRPAAWLRPSPSR